MATRRLSWWAAAPAVALMVAACGGAATTAPSSAPTTPQPGESATPAATPGAQRFDGVTVNVVTYVGTISPALQDHAPDWEALTGGKVNITTYPFSDLYQKALTDVVSGTNSFDLITIAAAWAGDFASGGYFEDLTDKVQASADLDWNDVTPFYRDVNASYGGRVFGVPLDGDVHTLYYRQDILSKDGVKPPTTWDEYIDVAKKYQGQDLNGDGTTDYGSCIAMKRGGVGTWLFNSVLTSFTQTQGTQQGAFFGENMSPLVNNEAMAKSLDIWKAMSEVGPPDQINVDQGTNWGLVMSGRCALTIDWGDDGSLSIDPATSKVINKLYTAVAPGTKEVLDRATGKLVPCDATTCPNAIDGVNRAPFAAFGGWIGAVNASVDQQKKDAAFSFLSYVSAPAQSNIDVTIGKTGMNPYRTSQFASLDPWVAAGFDEPAATSYLEAIKASTNSPNMVLDLRIGQANQYTNVLEDTAIAQFLAGELTSEEAMQQMFDGWQQLTDQIGRDKQAQAYADSLGVKR